VSVLEWGDSDQCAAVTVETLDELVETWQERTLTDTENYIPFMDEEIIDDYAEDSDLYGRRVYAFVDFFDED